MTGPREAAIRWYRKVFSAPAGSDVRDEGLVTVLDGNSAVALSEAGIASHAVLGGSAPSSGADSVWLNELGRGSTNLYGEALSAQTTEGPRGIVAAATGLALAGKRATAFLSGTDIAAVQDLLISAAGKHAPLVLHLGTRAATAHGSTPGSGHETVHLCADAGFFMLFAANVQEAVDFSYIARRLAEESLVPGMVIMDGEQTALAAQDVCLLSPAQANGIVGSPRGDVESPTAAQKLLFGETRRRVPAWHDLDEPVLTGALFEKESFALGALARRPFFDAFVEESMAGSFEQFARKTGRQYDALSRYRLDDAKTVLLAQGAAVETARVAADCLRKQYKTKVGVLGVHALRPFPGAAIATTLEGVQRVFVLERTDAPLSGEPPLIREIRASLDRGGGGRHPDCSSVVYGIGGLPLRVNDIVTLCTAEDKSSSTPRFLGVAFDDTSGEQPKRDVLLDTLRRAYPDAAALGVRASSDAPESPQKHALTIAIRRIEAHGGRGLLGATAALLHALEEGRIRSRSAMSWERWTEPRVDWLTHGDDSLQDPGDALTADISIDVAQGTVLRASRSEAFRVPPPAGVEVTSELHEEALLGGVFRVLADTKLLEQKPRRIIATRRKLLADADEGRLDDRLAAFQYGFEETAAIGGSDSRDASSRDRWEGEAPEAVRHLGRDDDHYASLPRFWDQAGVLYREGRSHRLTADPYLATGTMPPLSSTFSDMSETHAMLPEFEPALCTGCGLCWTHCPDSAIGVAAITPAALIDAGIKRTGAESVRQVAGKLASRIIAENKKAEEVAPTFGQMLDGAFSWLEDKMPLPDERKQAIREGIGGIKEEIGALPVSVTTPFFHDAEAHKKDGAELLSLVVNPDACKACGICIANCEPDALRARDQDKGSLATAREHWSTWTRSPDTAAETLERMAENSDIGVMSAILLSRYCQFALAGGDRAEAGSGEKMAVRLMLSATEFHQQPLARRFAESLAEAGESVSSLIQDTLSTTLDVDDLDAVTEKLTRTTSPRIDLKALAEGGSSADHSIDTGYLLHLIDLSKRIESAHHRLVEGEHGLGRARYGLAVAGGSTAAWAGAFPHNPFQAPVLIDMSGDAAQLSAGLIEGHLDETTELVRLLRLARLEVEQPDGADWKREALASLRWQDLTDEEFDLCPPMLLLGSDEMLAGRGLSQLIWLLNSGLPVKVLVMSSLDFGLHEAPTNSPRGDLGLLALAQRRAYVAQSSIADPGHYGETLLQALRFEGPALVQVYAPSPTRHGYRSEQTLEQAALAVKSRALPMFRYDPKGEGVFGSRISLQGNPSCKEALVTDEDDEALLTAADWALGQERFAPYFQPLPRDAGAPTPIHEWLALDARGRKGKTPYVVAGGGDEEQRYGMAPAIAEATEQRLQSWLTLQELAGIVTPFTERLEQDIRAELAAEHQAQLDAQKKASEAEIREIREKTEVEIASKIRSRLMQLASRKRG